MNINQSQELFHHGQHSNRYFTGPKRIDIYRFPIRRHKKYKKEKSNRIEFIKDELSFSNQSEANTSRRSSLSIYKGRTKGYNPKIRRNNNLSDFILSNNLSNRDEMSENTAVLNKIEIKGNDTIKSNKSSNRCLLLRRNRPRRKKVTFKRKFVEVIEVENYKKYNINEYKSISRIVSSWATFK